jgi:hypothetical protein
MGVAEDYTQLVFHVLAHVRLDGPGSTFDRRYLAWARARLEPADLEVLEHDASLLSRLWNADVRRYDQLHRLCDLHADLASARACADRSLAELRADEVADPPLLEHLRELEGAELIHATLALVEPRFTAVICELRPALAQARREVGVWLERLARWCPGLASVRVELVWALGMHGRALPGRILVGAPAAWNGCSPARAAVLAAHEFMVAQGSGDYVADEWAALRGLADALREAEPELRAAHREWLASLELGPLRAAATARGLTSA